MFSKNAKTGQSPWLVCENKISLPLFIGKFNPKDYIDWELEVEDELEYYEWSDEQKIKVATSKGNDILFSQTSLCISS